jgi:hypothetical protein
MTWSSLVLARLAGRTRLSLLSAVIPASDPPG